jgi:hypothetical protein
VKKLLVLLFLGAFLAAGVVGCGPAPSSAPAGGSK